MTQRLLISLATILCASVGFFDRAEARVFEFSQENFASYLRTTYGPISLGEKPFSQSMGTGVDVDKTSTYMLSAEVGFLYMVENLSFRAGVMLLIPQKFDDITGSAADGTDLYNLESEVFTWSPVLGVDIAFMQTKTQRAYFSLAVGYAMIRVKNIYTYTADGEASLGATSFEERYTQSAIPGTFGAGYEFHFTDTVTLSVEAGYRYLIASNFKYANGFTGPDGAHSKGDTVYDTDGSKKALNLSSAYAGISLQFYIDFVR